MVIKVIQSYPRNANFIWFIETEAGFKPSTFARGFGRGVEEKLKTVMA
jgi:hypothetical protein